MPTACASPLRDKLESTRELPTIPAILVPLLRYMEKPVDTVDMHEIVHLISQDKSLAARCLQVANCPFLAAAMKWQTSSQRSSRLVSIGSKRSQSLAL